MFTACGIMHRRCCQQAGITISQRPSHRLSFTNFPYYVARNCVSYINSMIKIVHIDIIQDSQPTYKHITEVRTLSTCYHGKAVSITYSECVSIALVIQHSTRVPGIILTSVACLILSYFSTLPHKLHDLGGGDLLNTGCFTTLGHNCRR